MSAAAKYSTRELVGLGGSVFFVNENDEEIATCHKKEDAERIAYALTEQYTRDIRKHHDVSVAVDVGEGRTSLLHAAPATPGLYRRVDVPPFTIESVLRVANFLERLITNAERAKAGDLDATRIRTTALGALNIARLHMNDPFEVGPRDEMRTAAYDSVLFDRLAILADTIQQTPTRDRFFDEGTTAEEQLEQLGRELGQVSK